MVNILLHKLTSLVSGTHFRKGLMSLDKVFQVAVRTYGSDGYRSAYVPYHTKHDTTCFEDGLNSGQTYSIPCTICAYAALDIS